MRCKFVFFRIALIWLLSYLVQDTSGFRSDEAEDKLGGKAPFSVEEGNTNSVINQHQFKRSLPDVYDEVLFAPNLMAENMMKSDLMAVSTPVKYREKRSKHSKKPAGKSSKRSDVTRPVNTKDELMNILGAIRAAKHHKLSRNDIRKLAKKAFAHLKQKKTDVKSNSDGVQKKKDVKKSEIKAEEKSDKKAKQKEVKGDGSSKAKQSKEKPVVTEKVSKTEKEDEKAFSNVFDDAGKTKKSEFAEDISKLGDTAKISEMLSDDSMTSKKSEFAANLEASMSTPTESPTAAAASQSIEQEINKELDGKAGKLHGEKKDATTKKSSIPDLGREEKIKTLKSLLAKANKSKVPKKFLQQFPAGLRMIAWRELLEKKRKELGELESLKTKEEVSKKSDSVDLEDHPVTVNIDIDPNADKSSAGVAKSTTEDGGHHIASHVKFLQKHLSSAQDLRKLISRALIGHCKATGKRILKAFIAMDKALARAQNIATVIGKKFKVDASKIETIVVNKEDEVVESFLRDIFSNFTPN